MAERWCKLYPHALTDPLWLAVADDAGTSPGLVGATFVELLTWTTEHAPDTGSIAGSTRGCGPPGCGSYRRRSSASSPACASSAASSATRSQIGRNAQGAAAIGMVAANVNKIARKVSTPQTANTASANGKASSCCPIAGTLGGVPEGVPAFPERVPDVPDAKTQAISASCVAAREREKERNPKIRFL